MHSRFALWAPMLALSLLPPSYAGRTRLAQIAVSGCEQLNRGGICELRTGRELSVWHAGSADLQAFAPDTRAWLTYAAEPADTGSLYRLPLRSGQTSLRLRFSTSSGEREQQLLQLQAAPSWPWQKQIEALENVPARELLSTLLPKAQGAERAFVLYELARREYRTSQRAQGQLHLQAAAVLAQELGRTSLARSCYGLLANHASAAHDFGASRDAIASAQQLGEPARGVTDAYGQALIANAQGVLAAELAALHDAAKAYEAANVWVERGASELRGHVLNGLAMVSVLQGRLLRAHELYSSLLSSAQGQSDLCFRAMALGNVGWVELELLRAGAADAATSADATRHLHESVEHYARCRATASWRPAHARLSVAYDALRRGDLAAAHQGIAAAGTFEDEPRMEQYRSLLTAELALAEGHAADAAERFASLHEQLRKTPSTEPTWRALEGLGRALAAQRRWPEAIERLEAAEQLLARAARDVPDPSALTSFFGTHDHSARGLREAYLATGKKDLAFRALRRAQRRHLLALARDQRVWERATSAQWQAAYAAVLQKRSELSESVRRANVLPDSERAAAEDTAAELRGALEAAQTRLLALLGRDVLAEDERLRAARPAELMVAWLRTEQGLEAYAAFGEDTRHIRYAQPPADGGYLEPLADWIAQARELTVLSFSEPESLDVHRLPFRGAPVIAQLPVAYSLDLPPRAAEAAQPIQLALLATDRRGDLVHAQRELDALERALGQRGWKVQELSEPGALQQQSPRPELFYYAGHGRADDTGALRSALALPGSELTVADILALRAAPEKVVLSACDAARAPDLREAVGISLAQAFVLAGSAEVLAPTRPVSDRAAELISALLRAGLVGREPLATIYRAALRNAGSRTELDAYAFRRVVP
jgi:hypothetical protein